MAAPPMPHADITGPFWTIAVLTAKPGKGDELEKMMKVVVAASNDKTKEPGTLSYTLLRAAGEESDIFTVVENYENREALVQHRKGEEYQKLRGSGLIAGLELRFHTAV